MRASKPPSRTLSLTRSEILYMGFVRSGKSQSESSPNFSNFCPEFCPEFLSEFSPNFLRSFRASFRGKRRPEKIHQKSPPFFNAKFPGKYEKIFTKCFWRGGKVRVLLCVFLVPYKTLSLQAHFPSSFVFFSETQLYGLIAFRWHICRCNGQREALETP